MNENAGKVASQLLAPNDFGKLRKYCSVQSIAHLKRSLEALERGMPPTPSFPLYGKRDRSIVERVLKDIIGKSDAPDWLKSYEESRIAKFGPQGGHAPWEELLENFLLYKTAPKPVKHVDEAIMRNLIQRYRALRCQVYTAKETMGHLIRTNKIETRAAGWSEFQLKKTDPEAQRIALRMALSGDWVHGYGYVFSRYNKLKRRIFMPMPFSSMIVQAKWFIPFLGGIQKSLLLEGTRSPYVFWADKIGFEPCFKLMEDEIHEANLRDDEYLVYFSNDFEKMDTRTGSDQYRNFFLPVLHAAFGNSGMDEAIMFTTTAPIISPSGTMTGDHGTASGAEVTNGGETTCNDYFQERLDKVLGTLLPPGTYRIIVRRGNGDDSTIIFAVRKGCSLEEFEAALRMALGIVSEETGFDVQTEKLDISDVYGKYCQNVYSYDRNTGKVFWTYPLTLITNSIMNPEHEYTPSQWDKDYRDIDVVEKLDNGVHHPAYEDFVRFVRDGMKYPLMGRSEPETKRILAKYDRYRQLQSLGERYNRQDYNIASSPTVQLLLQWRERG